VRAGLASVGHLDARSRQQLLRALKVCRRYCHYEFAAKVPQGATYPNSVAFKNFS